MIPAMIVPKIALGIGVALLWLIAAGPAPGEIQASQPVCRIVMMTGVEAQN